MICTGGDSPAADKGRAFSKRTEYVPDVDEAYKFDPQTTLAICALLVLGMAGLFNDFVMPAAWAGAMVVIPTRNRAQMAINAVRSILDQPVPRTSTRWCGPRPWHRSPSR